jgi:selenide,water dikinase
VAQPGPHKICVVGAGAAGVELILSIRFRLKKMLEELGRNSEELSYHLVSKSKQIMPSFPSSVRKRFNAILDERGVIVHRGVEAT